MDDHNGMEPQAADFHHLGVGEAITNSPDAAVSQDPFIISSVFVPHTNITNSIGGESLVSKTLPTSQDSSGRSGLRHENYNSLNDLNNSTWSSRNLEPKKKSRLQASTNLTKKEHELNELKKYLNKKHQEELFQLRSNHEVILQTKDQELDEVRKLWKQAGSDLNKFIAQGQGFHQVTDEELIQKVTQLRYNIRNFADRQFEGDAVDAKSLHCLWKSIRKYFRVSLGSLEACMKDSSSRPMIIEAILWGAIEMEIFGQFVWAGKHVSSAMYCLKHVLKPDENDTLALSHEAKRKFQMWKASTATLLLESETLDESSGHGSHRRPNERSLHDTICKLLSPFSKPKEKDFADQLFGILDEALNLDKLISKQAAEVIWLSDFSSQDLVELAALQQDEKQTVDGGNTWLVSAPGVIKRGKSTGEDFDVEIILLKMKVFQEPENIEQIGESHKKSTGSFMHRAKDLLNTRKQWQAA